MGYTRWSDSDWRSYAGTTSTKSTAAIFSKKGIDPDLDPKGVSLRESRDSLLNPCSTAIIVGLDVTGSMDCVLGTMAKTGLGTLISEIYARRPVSDPHLMLMGIGDAEAGDEAPLQATQFEADISIAGQLEKIWLEKGGGGNNHESYTLPWYFAATRTSIDCFEKRGKKGYLFTVGDEQAPPRLRGEDIERTLGEYIGSDFTASQLLVNVSRMYDVFHLVVEEGSYYRQSGDKVLRSWRDLLGQRTLRLSDHTKLAEVIVSAIEVNEGADAKTVSSSWDGSTGLVVARAMEGLTAAGRRSSTGPVFF